MNDLLAATEIKTLLHLLNFYVKYFNITIYLKWISNHFYSNYHVPALVLTTVLIVLL